MAPRNMRRVAEEVAEIRRIVNELLTRPIDPRLRIELDRIERKARAIEDHVRHGRHL